MSEGQAGETGAPALGRCAVHPDRVAHALCTRCGNYMCSGCEGRMQRGLCLACERLKGEGPFPFHRDNYDLGKLVAFAFARWKQHWGLLTLIAWCTVLAAYAIQISAGLLLGGFAGSEPWPVRLAQSLTRVPMAFRVAENIVQIGVGLAVLGVNLDILEARPPTWQGALARLAGLPATLAQMLIALLVVSLPFGIVFAVFARTRIFGALGATSTTLLAALALAIIVLGFAVVAVTSGFAFGMAELARNPRAGALASLRTCHRLVAGHRLRALGICSVAACIGAVGLFACGIGMFITMPFGQLIYCALFLALTNQRAPSADAGEIASP